MATCPVRFHPYAYITACDGAQLRAEGASQEEGLCPRSGIVYVGQLPLQTDPEVPVEVLLNYALLQLRCRPLVIRAIREMRVDPRTNAQYNRGGALVLVKDVAVFSRLLDTFNIWAIPTGLWIPLNAHQNYAIQQTARREKAQGPKEDRFAFYSANPLMRCPSATLRVERPKHEADAIALFSNPQTKSFMSANKKRRDTEPREGYVPELGIPSVRAPRFNRDELISSSVT